MDLRRVRRLIELVQETGIAELEVRNGDETIRIAQFGACASPQTPAPSVSGEPMSTPRTDNSAGFVMRAPMAGTFYRAPAPGEQPFVGVGDTVAVGDVLCIIESMKMMNKVESEFAGEVTAVLVDNGKPIESGTELFRIV